MNQRVWRSLRYPPLLPGMDVNTTHLRPNTPCERTPPLQVVLKYSGSGPARSASSCWIQNKRAFRGEEPASHDGDLTVSIMHGLQPETSANWKTKKLGTRTTTAIILNLILWYRPNGLTGRALSSLQLCSPLEVGGPRASHPWALGSRVRHRLA